MRTLARLLFVGVFAVVAAALGTVTALVTVPMGKDLLARVVTDESNRLVRGSVAIGRIRGDFLTGLTLDAVVVRDTAGVLLADIPRLELTFKLADLLATRFQFASVRALRPRLQVVKHRDGRMNYQEILRLGEGPPGAGPGTHFVMDHLEVEEGEITLWIPWNPDGRLRTARQRDSALVAERLKPGRRIEAGQRPADSLMSVRTIALAAGRFQSVRVATPDRLPFAMRIDSVAAQLSDPGVTITSLAGQITQGADSLLFDLDRLTLPQTAASGSGRIDWPRDTILYDFSLDVPAMDLVDLRWISPDFPALAGRGRVTAKSVAGSRTEYDLRDLLLADRTSRVAGRMVAILDVYRGLGFRDLDLALTSFDLDDIRPYLDTLPLVGRLTGPLHATGFFDRMKVAADWLFADAAVDSGAVNRVAFEGDVTLGGENGMRFHGLRLLSSDFDLRTIRRITPAVALNGRLALSGTLEGPWRNVVFDGRATHRDGARPASSLAGRARLDTRGAVLALDADLRVDSLSFDGIRPSFPTTTMQGRLAGTLVMAGRLDSLQVDADLSGAVGRYRIEGLTVLMPPRWEARNLRVRFSDADLTALGGRGPETRLAGRMVVSGRLDSLVPPEADVDLTMTAGRVREFNFDSARARFRIAGGLMTVDTAVVRWVAGEAAASGTLGWNSPAEGTLRLSAYALTLAPFDSLAAGILALQRADLTESELMSGRARVNATLAGSLDAWHLAGEAQVDSAAWLTSRIRVGTIGFEVDGGRERTLTLATTVVADSIAQGQFRLADVRARVAGRPGELDWQGTVAVGAGARVRAQGAWSGTADTLRALRIDSLEVDLHSRTWTLDRPATFTLDSVMIADTVTFATSDGSGQIQLAGSLPGRSPGQAEIHALGISLRDLYTLAQRDTTGVAGLVALDARIGGTRALPTFRGSATITGPVVGDVKAPLIRTVFDYDDRLLRTNLSFWRTGRPVLDVDAALPLDLAMTTTVSQRQLPGPLVIRGKADSVDLGVVEALTSNLRGVVGNLAVDALVEGTWEAPRLGGFIEVTDGAAYLPALRVGYGPFNARIRLSGDSIVADGVELRSGEGVATISGGIRLEQLTRPVLGLEVAAAEIPIIDVPDFLTLHGTGNVSLTGPLERPVLTGDARATSSVLYFADLFSKDIVNLEDPANADLVDTTALRTQDLRAQFQSRFLDSLTIRDLRFRVGQDVWLRSSEANVQLEGQVTVNKERRRAGRSEFRMSGQLSTPRGSYTLTLVAVKRTFSVEQGSVQYFNTPDLNAALDLSARYVVRTVTGTGTDEYPIIARITGTLLVPRVRLESEPGRQQLPERDLVSLLVFGTTSNSLLASSGGYLGEGFLTALAASAFSSEVERRLISSPDSPLDLIEFKPGFLQGNTAFSTGGTVTALSLGRQLSNRLFVILNLGGCFAQGSAAVFSQQYLGASLEYRLDPTLKLQVAAEPVQSCLSEVASSLVRPSRYQFGADLKWDREY